VRHVTSARTFGIRPDWPESASEPYRSSDCNLSAKPVLNFADRGCRVVSTAVFCVPSRPEPLLFLPSSSSVVLTKLSGPRS
jgi:hypothetical protein